MGTTQDVKDRIPGLQFRLESQTYGKKTAGGTQHGHITLHCEYTDVTLFDTAASKLNGFKVFGSLSDEIVEAISAELDDTDSKLQKALDEGARLRLELGEKEAEISRLRGLLQSIERELDDTIDGTGEALFNDNG